MTAPRFEHAKRPLRSGRWTLRFRIEVNGHEVGAVEAQPAGAGRVRYRAECHGAVHDPTDTLAVIRSWARTQCRLHDQETAT